MNPALVILSRSSKPFRDRLEAGKLLSIALEEFSGPSTVVLGIPRGGVVIAHQLAQHLKADLDIVLSRKLGAPGNLELAIGAIGETGQIFLNEHLAQQLSIDPDYIEQERQHQLNEIHRRCALFRKIYTKISLKNKTVIITDDGIATGATMQAALWSLRQEGAKEIIVALPVGHQKILEQLTRDAQKVVCLRVPSSLEAISQFYTHFTQITDQEVLDILKKHSQ
ncbi:MAG: phosphoribosyltransferase family protein [Candidatus Omnitrophota bacterium]|nr:phosphoribosyltransferase family protein [Candidatus Omnitrophota bacterium]